MPQEPIFAPTYNNVRHRLVAFALSNFVLMAFWVLFFV